MNTYVKHWKNPCILLKYLIILLIPSMSKLLVVQSSWKPWPKEIGLPFSKFHPWLCPSLHFHKISCDHTSSVIWWRWPSDYNACTIVWHPNCSRGRVWYSWNKLIFKFYSNNRLVHVELSYLLFFCGPDCALLMYL